MNFLMKSAVSAIALSCGVAVFDARPANAITLLDFIRGGNKGRTQSTIINPVEPAAPAMGNGESAPLPKVSSPQYYTYKPEALRFIDTERFADPVVTGAVADASANPTDIATLAPQRRFLMDARVRTTDHVAKVVEAYYNDNTRPLLWVSDNHISDKAKAAMAVLADAASVGLDPADYAVVLPSSDSAGIDPVAQNRALMQFEVALSSRVLTYVEDTVRGRVDPNKISGYHDFKRKDVNLDPVLKLIRMSPDVAAYLRSRSPDSPQFDALKAELAKLRAQDTGSGDKVVVTLGSLLRPGDSSPEIANIVKAISRYGSPALKAEHAATLASYQQSPDYSPELVALVEGFQKEKGLTPDGVIGQATVRAMVGDSNESKIDKLIVALEQARWLPEELGSRYVFINQPAFMVYYHNDNKEQLSMRVVVGQPSHQTFFFEDQIETVEFNPFWGVPQSIIINEMLPKLRSDPNYLDRMGYEVTMNGKAVPSASVNWYGSTNAVSVRQPPSDDNALGELKILFPNAHAIYMHDTPSKSFFKKDMRALSHGCVRLADPRAMAAAVLNTTVDDVAKQIATGKNRAVQVPQKIPVYIAYFTAWPNKNGVVEYFNDVYDRDSHTAAAFEATSKVRDAQI